MIRLTEDARAELLAYFAGREAGTLRIRVVSSECRGPRLALAPDVPDPDRDQLLEAEGLAFCMEKELADAVAGRTLCIDVGPMGFSVEPVREA